MTALLLQWGGIGVCALVLIGCICRADILKTSRDGHGWPVMFLLFGIYALGVMTDLILGRQLDWYEAAGMAGVLQYLALTKKAWKRGLPDLTGGAS